MRVRAAAGRRGLRRVVAVAGLFLGWAEWEGARGRWRERGGRGRRARPLGLEAGAASAWVVLVLAVARARAAASEAVGRSCKEMVWRAIS